MAESADATDLKSVGGDTVRVRPPLAPFFPLFVSKTPPVNNLIGKSMMEFLSGAKGFCIPQIEAGISKAFNI